MTMQMSDSFIFNDRKYVLCETEKYRELLDLDEFGLQTTQLSAACVRGYIATFAVREKNLELVGLQTRTSNKTIPKISGILPKVDELPSGEYRDLYYKGLHHKLTYSGGLVIGRNYIKRIHRSHYHAWPYDYKKVIRLKLENGVVVHAADISVLVASVCGGIKKLEKQGMYINDYRLIDWWFGAETREEYEARFPYVYGEKIVGNLPEAELKRKYGEAESDGIEESLLAYSRDSLRDDHPERGE